MPTFQQLAHTDLLEQTLVGVATRRYGRSLEAVGDSVVTRGTSKSSVSRRFVARTRAQVEAWQTRPLDALDVAVLLIDGCTSPGTVWWSRWGSMGAA